MCAAGSLHEIGTGGNRDGSGSSSMISIGSALPARLSTAGLM